MSKAYEKAGVNIEAGYEAVQRMKSHVERTVKKRNHGYIWWFRWYVRFIFFKL